MISYSLYRKHTTKINPQLSTVSPTYMLQHLSVILGKLVSSKYLKYRRSLYTVSKVLSINTVLDLNFKRKRFFPLIRTGDGSTLSFLSLGMVASRYGRGKPFYRKKPIFVKVASIIRKLLIYMFLTNVSLVIKRAPMYLVEILMSLFNPSLTSYNNPLQFF